MNNNLFKYLPSIYSNILEYKEIFNISEQIFEIFRKDMLTTQSNFFPYSQDIDFNGIERLEKALHIVSLCHSYEDRLFKIKTQLINKKPYNKANVNSMIAALCGNDGYRLYVDNDKLTVTVKLALAQIPQFDSVIKLLDNVLPANLQIIASAYNTHSVLSEKKHKDLSTYTYQKIKTEDIV